MDSPLLPKLRRQHQDLSSSPTNLLADLSITDSEFGAPGDDSFALYHQSTQPPTQHPGIEEDEDEEEVTPVKARKKGKAKARFSLFAPQPQEVNVEEDDEVDEDVEGDEAERGEGEGEDETIHPRSDTTGRPPDSRAGRDERLKESLYELQQMNQVFEGFLGALEAARGHNERLAVRVNETSALLDQYTALLGQAEHTQRLISNPRWTGAEDDAKALEAEEEERIIAEEARIAESRRLAEAARLAEEERERDRERAFRDAERAAAAPARGGSSAGTRGRGAPRGRGIPTGSTGIPRPSVPPSSKTPATGLRKPSGGLAGKYANVASSGYGPTRKPT